ncbi:hypothetical protein WJX73_009155 [Symbiochloris irregularis]|uniref:Acyltransferase 3 domain-containing protein n=1 Tax=Symbiochloris irregularis TaxID=706552 RepID=A0AAW1NWC6_9CHLO
MCAVSEAGFQRTGLDPLKGIRVLASTSVVLIHVGWLCGYASSAWRWYDVLEQKFWPNAILGFHGFLSMHAFFIMTGTTSAASLIPMLSSLKQAGRWQAVKSYWIRRASRIVPPYFCMILACTLTSLWLTHHPQSSTFEGQQLGYFFAQVPLREVWAHLCFLNNAMRYSLTSVWSWNLAIQLPHSQPLRDTAPWRRRPSRLMDHLLCRLCLIQW